MGMRSYYEVLETPVKGTYDVIVCGAGPAGIGAAVSAGAGGGRRGLLPPGPHKEGRVRTHKGAA